ncbi:MAG: GYD domain-containing protein [Actinomycetota bacterium]
MPHYMIQAAYTPEAWAKMVNSPQNRVEGIRPAVEAVGGTLETGYITFGKYDIMAIVEWPDNQSAAAFAMSVVAGGALSGYKTTPLLTAEEGMEAMSKASATGYKPPA